MDKHKIIGGLYRSLVKPGLFMVDAEAVHNGFTTIGETLGGNRWGREVTEKLLAVSDSRLKRRVLGVEFANPVGLAAGFDWDGHLAGIMRSVGFGFNTVGTVTAKPYGGNPKPRLGRLPKSQSLLVNKGFMSEGAQSVIARLDGKQLDGHVIGISVGSSNVPEVNTVSKAIEDYLFTFKTFADRSYVKYWELNISCPNTAMTESFGEAANFRKLAEEVGKLKLKQPVFVKMPNETETAQMFELVRTALKHNIRGFIFANLVKDRTNPGFDRKEMEQFNQLKGNFSGKPTQKNADWQIARARREFGKEIAIIGCGGVFGAEDARRKFAAGADLVQLITGMIYQGPQLPGEICRGL